jgi:hypothetical protein
MCYDQRSSLPGQYALQLSIYGHQAKPLLKHSEDWLIGKFVHCRNIRPKLNANGFLEATMYIDKDRQDKSDVSLRDKAALAKNSWYKDFERFVSFVLVSASLRVEQI